MSVCKIILDKMPLSKISRDEITVDKRENNCKQNVSIQNAVNKV